MKPIFVVAFIGAIIGVALEVFYANASLTDVDLILEGAFYGALLPLALIASLFVLLILYGFIRTIFRHYVARQYLRERERYLILQDYLQERERHRDNR